MLLLKKKTDKLKTITIKISEKYIFIEICYF